MITVHSVQAYAMARVSLNLTVTFAVLLFFLTLSHARVPAILPTNNVVVGGELSNSLPDSDVGPIISLPSDNVNADPQGETKESEQPVAVASVPLTLAKFRPVNRHFLARSRFPSRPCHHHRHNNGLFKPRMRQVEVSYGDDMILSSGENGDFVDHMMFHPRVRRIPARWVRFHHHHSHHHDDENDNGGLATFVFKHSDKFGKEKFKKHLHHENEENEEERHVEKVKNNEDGGFMTRIRKILDHF